MNGAQQPPPPLAQGGRAPTNIAAVVGMCARAFIEIMFWIVVIAACAAGAFMALAAVWWALQQVRHATGI